MNRYGFGDNVLYDDAAGWRCWDGYLTWQKRGVGGDTSWIDSVIIALLYEFCRSANH